MWRDKSLDQLGYASENFSTAVKLLATGSGDIRSRLRAVFDEIHPVQSSLLPEDIRKKYDSILDKLTAKDKRSERDSKLNATLFRMRNKTKEQIAESIVDLKHEIGEVIIMKKCKSAS